MPTGSKIKEIRLQKQLTQKQLGDKCGMYESQIRKYETGKANPKIETLQKIADALEVSVSDLLLDDDYIDIEEIINDPQFLSRLSNYLTNNQISAQDKENLMNVILSNGSSAVQSHISYAAIAQKDLLNFYFDDLNIKGKDKALEQVEMLTKIPDYRKDVISDMQILEQETQKETSNLVVEGSTLRNICNDIAGIKQPDVDNGSSVVEDAITKAKKDMSKNTQK